MAINVATCNDFKDEEKFPIKNLYFFSKKAR